METKKLHIVVEPQDGDYYTVTLIKQSKGMTLRTYKSDPISARKFADDLSDLIGCDWQDIRRK